MSNAPLGSVRVDLLPWEHDWARHVGERRHTIRSSAGSRDAAHYDPRRMEDNLTASIAAAAAELAVAKYKGLFWSGHYWLVKDHRLYKGLPDVEPNIEVRRIREPGNPLAIRRRDVEADRLMVCAWSDPETEFRSVYVVGEITAFEGWERGKPAFYDRFGTRTLEQAMLSHYGRVAKAA